MMLSALQQPVQVVHKTWTGTAIPWRRQLPPVRVMGCTLVPARTQPVLTELVSLTREDLGIDRQAHPQRAISAALARGYSPCQRGLVRAIAQTVLPKGQRYVIVVREGKEPAIFYAPGNNQSLRRVQLTLDAVRFVPWSVVLAKS